MPDMQRMRGYLEEVSDSLPRSRTELKYFCIDQLKEAVAAIHFLSIIYIPGSMRLFQINANYSDTDFIVGPAYFPLVGLLIAGLLCVVLLIAGLYLPLLVLAAFLLIAHVVLTGGLHLDGLMDCCDGLFGGTTPERRLDIMRDSRVGSFGVLGGVCVLLFKFAIFASLSSHLLIQALLMVLPVARWGMVLAVSLFPSARTTGLGATFRQTVTTPRLLWAGLSTLIIVLVVGHWVGLLVWLVGSLVAASMGAWMTRSLRGLTGDTYGAIEEVTEMVLFLLIILLRFWL